MSRTQLTGERVVVGLAERSYPILIGHGTLDNVGATFQSVSFPSRVALITNPTVASFYQDRVEKSLRLAGFDALTITVQDGEIYKSLATLESIYDQLIAARFDRNCGLVALGGGVVGDMTGFAAATFLRGIPFAQIPTTLLAQVDSSVGGKTAVNHRSGKNLIGAFYQPKLVFIDVATLATLPEREYLAGIAEVVKYGIISDHDFFQQLDAEALRLLAREPEVLVAVVKRSCQIKANVVELDETETSLRAILNFGHTFGHAVETATGYVDYLHGEAVAVGMLVAARIAARMGFCTAADVATIERVFKKLKLPVVPPRYPLEIFLSAMMRDKKVKSGVLRMALNKGIGDCTIVDIEHPEKIFAQVLA